MFRFNRFNESNIDNSSDLLNENTPFEVEEEPEPEKITEPLIPYVKYRDGAGEPYQLLELTERQFNTHHLTIGSTGTGKSYFFESQILQVLNSGRGFLLFEPHGQTTRRVLEFIYFRYEVLKRTGQEQEARRFLDRIIYLDPLDESSITHFNPLEVGPSQTPSSVAETLITTFNSIWKDAWGQRMDSLFRSLFIALAQQGRTLFDAYLFLHNAKVRRAIIKNTENMIARETLKSYELYNSESSYGAVKYREMVDPIMTRLSKILADDSLSAMFTSAQSDFSFDDVLENNKIVILNFPSGRFEELGTFFSNLFFSLFLSHCQNRTCTDPYYVFIDEFNHYARNNIRYQAAFTELRKFGINMRIAFQHTAGTSSELLEAIISCCDIKNFFHVGYHDSVKGGNELFDPTGKKVKYANFHAGSNVYYTVNEETEINNRRLKQLKKRKMITKVEQDPVVYGESLQIWDLLPIYPGQNLAGSLGFDSDDDFQKAVDLCGIGGKYRSARQPFEPGEEDFETETHTKESRGGAKAKSTVKEKVFVSPEEVRKFETILKKEHYPDSEMDFLKILYEVNFATKTQICFLLFPDDKKDGKWTRFRNRNLKKNGFIEETKFKSQLMVTSSAKKGTRTESVYRITARGVSFLNFARRYDISSEKSERASKSPENIQHDLFLTQVRFLLEKAVMGLSGETDFLFLDQYEKNPSGGYWCVFGTSREEDYYLDGVFMVRKNGEQKRRLFFLEVDRGNRSVKETVEKKITPFGMLLKSGRWQERFGNDCELPVLLFVCEGKSRKDNFLQKRIEHVLVIDYSCLNENNILEEPIWWNQEGTKISLI